QLAKVKLPAEQTRDHTKGNTRITLADLNRKTGFDFYANIVLPIWKSSSIEPQITLHNEVLIADIDYYVQAAKILSQTPARTVSNYISWFVVHQNAPFASEQFRKIVFEYAK